MRNLHTKLIGLAFVSLLLAGVVVISYHPPAAALFGNSKKTACDALGSSCGTGAVTVGDIIKSIIGILSYVVGVAAVIMVIIGGFRYITSNGDSNQISSAKNTIIYALIGLVIAVLARAIVAFVFNRL